MEEDFSHCHTPTEEDALPDDTDGYDPLYPTREIIFRAWSDDAFKQRLLQEPITVLKEFGAKVPDSITEVRVVENTNNTAYFILPREPDSATGKTEDEIRELLDNMLLTQLVFPTVLSSE